MKSRKTNNMVENTILNTIKLVNTDKLTSKKISAYTYRDDVYLDRIYKIEPPKQIYFNVFGIENSINSSLPIYFDNKLSKKRSFVCVLVITYLVYELISDKKDDAMQESFKFAAKWLLQHKRNAHKIVGQIDISNLADIVLCPCEMYSSYMK